MMLGKRSKKQSFIETKILTAEAKEQLATLHRRSSFNITVKHKRRHTVLRF